MPLLLIASGAVAACRTSPSSSGAPASTNPFDTWSETFLHQRRVKAPQLATRTQYLSATEQDALDRQLAPIGEWGHPFGVTVSSERAAAARRAREKLPRISEDSMTPLQRASAALLLWSLDDTIASSDFATHTYVFEQYGGLQLDIVNHLTQTHPIRNSRDIDNYLARLALVASVLDQGVVGGTHCRGGRRYHAASFHPGPHDRANRSVLEGGSRDNVFVVTLRERMLMLGDAVPTADRDTFVDAAERTVRESVIPAFRRVRDLLVEQRSRATDDAGVWRLPRGGEFYVPGIPIVDDHQLDA